MHRTATPGPIRYGLLIFPSFPMMAFASVVEPLRAANVIAGRQLYDWLAVAVEPGPVRASNHFALTPDHLATEMPVVDRIVVVSGGDAEKLRSEAALRWIRAMLRRGAWLGAVADAAFFLAAHGLLDGYRCTLHWTSQPAFREAFPQIDLARSLFVIDRSRFTSLGGVGAFDMMLALIEKDHDAKLALQVADWYAHSPLRSPLDRSAMPLPLRSGIRDVLVLNAVAEMEAATDGDLQIAALAKRHGVSRDTLERAFRAEFGETPGSYFRKMRLRHARDLLVHSGMKVEEVGFACGYASASAFSRAFQTMFGVSPSAVRAG